MIENNVPSYLEPHRFTTRTSEVSKEKPGKELVIDQAHLTVKDIEQKDKCPMHNELQVFQAFTRPSLACDLMGVCTFKCMERWHRFLMDSAGFGTLGVQSSNHGPGASGRQSWMGETCREGGLSQAQIGWLFTP